MAHIQMTGYKELKGSCVEIKKNVLRENRELMPVLMEERSKKVCVLGVTYLAYEVDLWGLTLLSSL